MFNRSKMLLLSVLTLCVVVFAVGCDQPEDVITPNGKAYLTLTPERLPDNPSGTIYELWVANDTDTLSLGKFGYNYISRKFLTEVGNDRSEGGKFFLDENIGNYNSIFVSVEPTNDALPNSPASIMLVDFTSSQTIKLTLPAIDSLWDATVRYNMVSTSDGEGTAKDGSSIWFSSYKWSLLTVIDTVALLEWHLDSGEYVDANTFTPIVNVIGIDSSTLVENVDTIMAFDLDTIVRKIVRFEPILSYDTSDYYPTVLKATYSEIERSVVEEKFTQDDFELPNLQKYGWKYRGWVISDVIDPAGVGNITLPAWSFLSPILDNVNGGLLSTGAFYDISAPDLENPYVDTIFRNPPRVPKFPGEDFLINLPAPITSVPNMAGTPGHVFITVEPEFYDDSTNFPLFAFIGNLPSYSSGATAAIQGYTLTGYMYSNDPFRGFPSILVTVDSF